MAIYLDEPVRYRVPAMGGRTMLCAHLFSDRTGMDGTSELLNFAIGMGLEPRWIQHQGTPKEHFDLLGQKRIADAVTAGAVRLTRHAAVAIWRAKRDV